MVMEKVPPAFWGFQVTASEGAQEGREPSQEHGSPED